MVINTSDSHISVAAGNVLTGFGKIQFRNIGTDNAAAFDADLDLAFAPKDSSTKIIMEPHLTTIGDEIVKKSKEKSSDAAKVCYHTIEQAPGQETGTFILKQDVNVVARSKDMTQQGTVTGSNFGCFVPLKTWMPPAPCPEPPAAGEAGGGDAPPSPWFEVVWACKWGPNGIMPVRPLVVVTSQLEIPAKHAVAI